MLARQIAKAGLDIKAIKLNPDNPFTWASGFRMPIYNDNRMFLFYPGSRAMIISSFHDAISQRFNDTRSLVISGVATAGIPWGALLAEELKLPFVYVRDKPKDHGLKNRIEGIDGEEDLQGYHVVLVEDLISTGESSARAVQAVRDAKGTCNHCVSVFNYGFAVAEHEFHDLHPECHVASLLTYDTLMDVAKQTRYVSEEQVKMLNEWRWDPFNWGEKHGFPKVEKK